MRTVYCFVLLLVFSLVIATGTSYAGTDLDENGDHDDGPPLEFATQAWQFRECFHNVPVLLLGSWSREEKQQVQGALVVWATRAREIYDPRFRCTKVPHRIILRKGWVQKDPVTEVSDKDPAGTGDFTYFVDHLVDFPEKTTVREVYRYIGISDQLPGVPPPSAVVMFGYGYWGDRAKHSLKQMVSECAEFLGEQGKSVLKSMSPSGPMRR